MTGETIDFLPGSGELATLIRAFDWSKTPLGPMEHWPLSLRLATSLVVTSPTAMVMHWGREGVMIYNDAYSRFVGDRHPALLGANVREGWAEIADFADRVMNRCLAGEALTYRDQELILHRNGRSERAWLNLDYSPVHDETARPAGAIAIVAETTERVLADRHVAEEREQLAQMFAQAPTFMALLRGPDFRFELANPGYVRLAGDRPLLGLTFAEALPDAVEQGFLKLLDEVYATGEPFVAEGATYWEQADPERPARERIVDFVYQPIKDGQGKVTAIFCEGADVTERVRADRALRASEARLRHLNVDLEREVTSRTHVGGKTWSLSPEILGVCNDQGFFESSNPAWRETLGWSAEELAATPLFDLIHPADVDRTRAAFAALQHGEPVLRFQNRYRRKDGGYRWLSWVAVPDDGRFYCSARDITAEKDAEAERDRLWTLSEDLLARADYAGGLLAVNPAWTKVLGWSEQELLTNAYADIIHPDNLDTVTAALAEMGRTGQPTRFENRIRDVRGAWKPIGWTVSPEPGGVNFIAIGRDLTDDKAHERELAQAQEALRQAQKMEAIGQLTGGVAHDFNNLLTVILSATEMLQRPGHSQERRARYVSAIADTVGRASRLTQQLLAFARRQTLKPEVFDVGRSVTAVSEMVGTLAGSRIDVRLDGPKEPCFTRADPSQFDTAIVNMVVNARDAMDGEGRLTICVKAVESIPALRERPVMPGAFVAIAIADTGSGIAPEAMEQIFEPFYTTKKVGAGTGLGLSQVFGFARQSEGEIQVESQLGIGTTFTLYIPRVSEREVECDVSPAELPANGDGMCVLVVEDNPEVGASTVLALEELGFTTVLAPDGREALEELHRGPDRFDVVFSDVVMPGMTGVELGQQIRRFYPDLPVVLASGYSHVLAQHGTYGFELIHKPYSIGEVSRVLRKAAAWRDRARAPAE